MSLSNILITGVSGFIGTNLYLEIQKRYPDCKIIGIDNFSSSNIRNLKYFKGDFLSADLRDSNWLLQLKNVQFDTIFHLAANVDTQNYNSLEQTTNNVESFRNVLTLASLYSTKVVWASSASVYGNNKNKTPSNENDELNPDSPYAISKMLCENLAKQCYTKDWPIIGIRPFNVFGLYEDYKGPMCSMVVKLISQAKKWKSCHIFKGTQDCVRDFIFVQDLVDLFISAALHGKESTIYNGGSGDAITFETLIDLIYSKMPLGVGQNLEIGYIDNPPAHYQRYTRADLNKVKKDLNWSPKHNFNSALDLIMEKV